jgi:polyisoprenoid-binding protein YceI
VKRADPGAAVLVVLLAWPGSAAEQQASWRIGRGEVRVVCPLTVGGSFEAKTTSLSGTLALETARPAAFVGGLSVDLRTLDTGIGLRNAHLRDNYLEVGKGPLFERAVLSEIRLAGGEAEAFEGRSGFTGSLWLHGRSRPISGHAELRREGSSVRVEASFPVTLDDYGIEKPRYLGVGVKSVVQVKVSLTATPAAEPAGDGR